MKLADVAMVAAETTRSRAYIQALTRHDLLPSHVLILASAAVTPLPGQHVAAATDSSRERAIDSAECWSEAHFKVDEPVQTTLDRFGIPHATIVDASINDPRVVDFIRQRSEPLFIYSGYGGVILRESVLNTGKRFLHVHGGYLPDYKGSTTNYFSLIEDNSLGASALFLSSELDSGPLLHRRKFPPPSRREEIDHVYDPAARAKVLVETLRRHAERGLDEIEVPAAAVGETYFVIHPVLKHIAILAEPGGASCG